MFAIKTLSSLPKKTLSRIMHRSGFDLETHKKYVEEIINRVIREGDKALKEFTKKFDKVSLQSVCVTTEERDNAFRTVSPNVIKALEHAHSNIAAFHTNHALPKESPVTVQDGITAWREWRPIEKVGLYIPGGRAVLPSTVLMTAVPAKIAGCSTIVVCCPPTSEGLLPPVTLVACSIAGIDVKTIFKVGGAHAVAAMAYGTASIPAVSKIFGPGSTLVTLAKMLCFGKIAIDSPAGPSEILILADDSAPPRFIASDLLSQAEHGADSAAILVTPSVTLAKAVQSELKMMIKTLPRKEFILSSLSSYGMAIITDSIDEAITFTNAYAPEHLEIVTENPHNLLPRITHAGSIFLGPYSPVSAGDYATGTNHVLPTAQYAKMFQALSVEAFGTKIQVQELTKSGLASIRETVETLAGGEGLEAHRRAIETRFTGLIP